MGGVPLSGEFTAETAGGMTMLRFTDGEATVYLRDGESVTVRGLPYGTEWTVCEQKTPD